MSIEPLADVVGGGLLARAVEPHAGEVARDGHTHEANCLNCGAALGGAFCSACGQHAHVHRTLAAFFHDFLHGVFHFEGKVWRTLPMLAWRPGELTRRYIDGQRASFLSPMALFLFSVFLMFAVLGTNLNGPNVSSGMGTQISVAAKDQQALVRSLKVQRASAIAEGKPVVKLDAQIASEVGDLKVLEAVRDRRVTQFKTSLNEVPSWINNGIAKARENPDLTLYKMRNSTYKYSWALIPISVPFLWLLFPFSRRFRMYDHIVFVTYSISFMMMLVIGGSLLAMAGVGGIVGLLALIPPVHLYTQLKGTYGLTRFGALWRTVVLTSFAFVAVVIFALAMVALGVLD